MGMKVGLGQYNFTCHLNSIHHTWQCKRRISSWALSYSGLSGRAACIVDLLKRNKKVSSLQKYTYLFEFLYELTCMQANNDVLDIILALESVLNRMLMSAKWGRICGFFPVANLEVILGGVFLDMLHWNERQSCFCVMPLCLCIHEGTWSHMDTALLPLHTLEFSFQRHGTKSPGFGASHPPAGLE